MKPSYIEREAILCYLNDVWISNSPNDFMSAYRRRLSTGYCEGIIDAMDAIREAPAADVRSVMCGKWNKRRFSKLACGYECSVCHTTWDNKTNYCPYCGADMRGNKHETI